MSDFKLYGYFRSSAAFRVRIALNIKGVIAEQYFVHLLKDGGRHKTDTYKSVNPQQLIPTLVHRNYVIGQSLAILEYLEEVVPRPPLLPIDRNERARVRQIALAIACDIHPLNNLRVLQHLEDELGQDAGARADWQRTWIARGFTALETMLARDAATGSFCHGDTPTMADVCLIPQMANARRADVPLDAYPTLLRIETAASNLPSFDNARPERQLDAE
jgi:maleylpyruvate isomerase